MSCKYLDPDLSNCLIIYQLTNIEHCPTPEECKICSNCDPPQTVNDFTRSLSNQFLAEEGRPLLFRGTGPGQRLKNTLSWFVPYDPTCNCEDRAKIMDAWGVPGCEEHFYTIVHWLAENAREKQIPITRTAIAALLWIILRTPYSQERSTVS